MPTEYNYASESFLGLAINDTVDSDVPDNVTDRPHVFLGVIFKNSGSVATPSAGTYSLKVETVNNPGVYQDVSGAQSVDATASLTTHSVSGNITSVRVVTDSISGVDAVDLHVTANAA